MSERTRAEGALYTMVQVTLVGALALLCAAALLAGVYGCLWLFRQIMVTSMCA